MDVIVAKTKDEIDQCMQIRREVFISEQGYSPTIEINQEDPKSVHFLLLNQESKEPIGVGRFFEVEPGVAKVGRVAIVKKVRGTGAGKVLMEGLEAEARRRGLISMKLFSQADAKRFYLRCGFREEGEEFMEEGTPHILMVKHF